MIKKYILVYYIGKMSLISPVLLFNRRSLTEVLCILQMGERERERHGGILKIQTYLLYIYTFKFNLRSWHPNVCAVALHKGLYLCCMYCNARCAIFVYATHVASHI